VITTVVSPLWGQKRRGVLTLLHGWTGRIVALNPHNQSINCSQNLSSSVSAVCRPVVSFWTAVINVALSPSAHLSGALSAVFF